MFHNLEGTVRTLDESLDTGLDLAQLLGGGAQARDALLEQSERALEVDLLGLQLDHDLLETLEALLEAHFCSPARTSSARAATWPSRRTRVNGMSRWKPLIEVNACPSAARATA